MPDLWDYFDELIASSRVVIDRPRGSAHPRYPALIYPLDYGYLDGTTAGDGDGIDVFVGGAPNRALTALALTVDLHKRDAEIKLLLGCTPDDEQIVLDFLNGASMRATLVRRGGEAAWLRSRRSVRRFRDEPVPLETLRAVLETATHAPSAHNRQPWRFAVLTAAEAKQRLAQDLAVDFRRALLADGLPWEDVEAQVQRSQARIGGAPAVIVLCLDATTGDVYPDPARQAVEALMGAQGVALAGGTLLLAAHACGLGGVWMCAPLFAPQVVQQALDLPPAWQPQGLILLGYPARVPPERPRRGIDEIAKFFV